MDRLMKKIIAILFALFPSFVCAQINTERVMTIARNALYFEDYVLSIQYFNQVINAKPYLYEPYFFRGLAKMNLDDYQGAEADCDKAIERNPFVLGAYQVRGLSRIHQGKFKEAVEDYKKSITFSPFEVGLWHNLALCHIQMKSYNDAKQDIAQLLKLQPKYARAYLMRGEVSLSLKDTTAALVDFDKVIELDKFEPDAWTAKAMISMQRLKYKIAESEFSEAIKLNNRNAGNFINRALVRFHQNNLRGAMSDYDSALEVEPNNFIGHYNRGLLRAQVGDDNRAIEDFNFVLKIDKTDMMATFNRGLLRAQTGDYKGAVRDYTTVIKKYPNFLAGYYQRAAARRRMGDIKGAEADEMKIMRAQLAKQFGGGKTFVPKKNSGGERTRKKSDKNIDNYQKIVTSDDSEQDREYKSEYRGKVQDKNVAIQLQPMFALSYYEKDNEVKHIINYNESIDKLNRNKALPNRLLITNMETSLSEAQVKEHFSLIDKHTSVIIKDSTNAVKRFVRAMDFYLVQDFISATEDLTRTIANDNHFFPAYFMRALIRCKQLEYMKSQSADNAAKTDEIKPKKEITAVDYDIVKADLDSVIKIAPDFVYAYYNRGNVKSMLKDYRGAIDDYNKAIELNKDFADAYFNRGLTYIFIGENKRGITDLSKAGELGLFTAYNIIKRFTEQ